mgnify:CR=1 FL=1
MSDYEKQAAALRARAAQNFKEIAAESLDKYQTHIAFPNI